MSFTYDGTSVITQANEAGKSITAVADGGSNELDLSVATHGYAAGDLIEVTGTTSYNGIYIVSSSISAGVVAIPDTDIYGNQNVFGATETGTIARGDKNLTGISGLTGVITTTPSSADNATIYDLSAVQLKVTGALRFNASEERIRYNSVIATQAQLYVDGGNLVVKAEATINSVTNANKNLPSIDFDQGDLDFSGHNVTSTHLYVNNAGTATLSGTYLLPSSTAGGAIVTNDANSTITLIDASLLNYVTAENQQLRCVQGTINLTRTEIYGLALQIGNGGTLGTFDDVLIRDNNVTIVINQVSADSYTEFSGLQASNAGTNVRHNAGGLNGWKHHAKLINPEFGGNFTYSTDATDPSRAVVIKKYDLAPKNENGGSITATYYAIDTDSTNRDVDYTENTTAITYVTSDDITYSGTTSSSTIDVAVAFGNENGTVDNRGENANGDITFYWHKHGRLPTSIRPSTLGITNAIMSPILITDIAVTETTKATVDLYETLNTSMELYDRHSSFIEDNLDLYQTLFLTRSGNSIDAGTHHVTIDATAGSAFTYDGTTITIKSTNFVGNITTTGLVSLLNGATVDGVVTDSTGTTGLPGVRINNLPENAKVCVAGYPVETAGGTGIVKIVLSPNTTYTALVAHPDYKERMIKFQVVTEEVTVDGTMEIYTVKNNLPSRPDANFSFVENAGVITITDTDGEFIVQNLVKDVHQYNYDNISTTGVFGIFNMILSNYVEVDRSAQLIQATSAISVTDGSIRKINNAPVFSPDVTVNQVSG